MELQAKKQNIFKHQILGFDFLNLELHCCMYFKKFQKISSIVQGAAT